MREGRRPQGRQRSLIVVDQGSVSISFELSKVSSVSSLLVQFGSGLVELLLSIPDHPFLLARL
jgi:hypothetical protein